jgi:hypothetical protein
MMAIYHGCFGTDILIPGACFAMVLLLLGKRQRIGSKIESDSMV